MILVNQAMNVIGSADGPTAILIKGDKDFIFIIFFLIIIIGLVIYILLRRNK